MQGATPPPPCSLQDELDRARLRWHVAASPASAAATLLAGAVLAMLMAEGVGAAWSAGWWLALAAAMVVRLVWRARVHGGAQDSPARVRRGLRGMRLLFGLHGAVWVAAVLLMAQLQDHREAAHAGDFIVAAMIGGALVTSAFDLAAASLFAVPVGLALLLRLAGWGGPSEPTLLLVTGVFVGVMALAGRRASQLLAREATAELERQQHLLRAQRLADEAEAARQALAQQHGLMQQLIRNTRQGFWFVDTEGRTRDLNPAMCALLGLPREAVLGRDVLEFFEGEQRAQMQAQLALRRLGESSTYEIDVRQPDGRWRHAVNQATPIFDLQGRPLGSIGLWTDLHAQKALEDRLRMHEHVSNSMTDALAVIDREGQCLLVNDAWCQLFGNTREQALQQRVDRRGHGPLQAIDPAAIARCFALGTEQTQVVQVPAPSPGAQDRWFQTTLVPYRDGAQVTDRVLLVLRDITAQAQDRQAVAVAAEHLDRTLNATQDAIFASDATTPDQPVRFVNDQLRRLFGLPLDTGTLPTPQQIMDAALPMFVDPALELAVIRRTMDHHEAVEHAVHLLDGRVLQRRCQQAWVQGHWLRVWSFRDISAEVRLRGLLQEREAQQQALALALQAAEQANRAKSQFLSHMSHELRTPLNGIAGFAQLLKRDEHPALAEHQRGYARQILRGSEHLLDLINDVLDLASVEAGRLVVDHEPVPLAEVVDDCQALVESLARARGVSLHPPTGLAGASPLVAQADRRRLRQVLLNLLGNAIKYNRPAGHVQVCGRRVGDQVQIEVQDSGRGLSAEEQARLFTPFERLDAARGPVEGTGIGLVLSRRLVHAMGGQLDLRSQPGVGSSFRVQLPAAHAEAPALVVQAPLTGLPPAAGGPLTLLYIDDNEVNLMVVAALAHGNQDLKVLSAIDGPAGLALARAEQPDLVLLDIHMPAMDGYAVLAALQAEPTTAAIPVVALSADTSSADVQAARAAGFADYLSKPLDLDRLLATVHGLARRHTVLH